MKTNSVLKIIYATSILACLSACTYAQEVSVKGKVLDDQLKKAVGTPVINLSSKANTVTNGDGIYEIHGIVGDTIEFRYIGCAKEKRVIANNGQIINVLMIDKTVNDLGAIWSRKQWQKADKQIAKRYRELEKEAQKQGKWNF